MLTVKRSRLATKSDSNKKTNISKYGMAFLKLILLTYAVYGEGVDAYLYDNISENNIDIL